MQAFIWWWQGGPCAMYTYSTSSQPDMLHTIACYSLAAKRLKNVPRRNKIGIITPKEVIEEGGFFNFKF